MSPLSRVLNFGDRSGALLIGVALFASTSIHSTLALAAYMREVTVTPTDPVCRAGEAIQFEAFARSAWNSRLGVTNSASWSVSDNKIASHAGGGFFRCVAEGNVTVTTTYLNRSTTFTLKVEPALVMVDIPEEKKEEPPPPPPPPEPEPQPEVKPAEPPPEAKNEPPPPAAAKVGNLLTAPDDPKADKSDEPYSFLTDPNGNEYGSGAAAIGGTADKAPPGAVASGKPGGTGTVAAPPPPPPPGPTVDLSRKASLPNAANACKGFFPGDADDDVATVKVMVTVKPGGEVASVTVMDENPKGQGFGKAARNCLLPAKFEPALDKDGKPTSGTLQFNIKFTR